MSGDQVVCLEVREHGQNSESKSRSQIALLEVTGCVQGSSGVSGGHKVCQKTKECG